MHNYETIVAAVLDFPNRPPRTAAQYKKNGSWIKFTWSDYYQEIERIGAYLIENGLKKGDKVALVANTRFEWAALDNATLGSQGVLVPIYQNSTPEEISYILNHSEARFLFIENETTLKVWKKIKDQCPSVEKVIVIENKSPLGEEFKTWSQALETGTQALKKMPTLFKRRALEVHVHDDATLIYTSGTTGTPKGVLLTHQQIVSEVSEVFPVLGIADTDISLTFLPYAHVIGRVEHWGSTWFGFTLSFAESIEAIRGNLVEIQPTLMVAVPRIFEKIYAALWVQMENQPLKSKLFKWALNVGKKVSDLKLTRSQIPLALLAEYLLADRLVLSKVRAAFGGRLRYCLSGGAPISREIAQFFHACGVLILEGYGLTETTAAVCVNSPFNYKFGSVGKPVGDTEIKIAEDGEILVRSHKVMKEYYKNPTATKEVLNDGWFQTGDIGEILPSGDLKITDRKKDLIKTAGGKYVAPQKLEGLVKMNPLISQILIHGDLKKFIVALVTLDRNQLEKIAKEKMWDTGQWQEISQKSEVYEMVRRTISEVNAKLASYETIKKFAILPTEFSIEGGELTPSMKIKRKYVDQKYQKEIESLYH